MVNPVTVVVRRRVPRERAEAFEAWLRGVIAAASQFEGHLGASVARPVDPSRQDWVTIFRFDSIEHLAAWERSEIRAEWLAKAAPLTEGEATMEKVTGLEFWFSLPHHAASKPPPRHKMALATVVGLYPLILFVAPNLGSLLTEWPRPLATLASTAMMVALMTWLVMPLVTRALSFWLFAPARRA